MWVGYEGKTSAPAPKIREGSKEEVCLGSFNSLGKLTAETLALWAKVLHALPDARLLLKAKELADAVARDRILLSLLGHGVASDRIELHDWRATPDWSSNMAFYDRLDIALDPIGSISGGTTTCDSLWMAVPVVTLLGNRMGSRMTASMLMAIGRAEWIAHTENEYVLKVVSLARNKTLRDAIRLSLRDEVTMTALFDVRDLTAKLEQTFFSMYAR